MILRSGDTLKLAPGANNPSGLKALHLIHPDLFVYRRWGTVDVTWQGYEDTQLGGDLRLTKLGLSKASWSIARMTDCALTALLDFIEFDPDTDLDAPITCRTWNAAARTFVNCSGIVSYLPASISNQEASPFEVLPVVLNYSVLTVLS